MLGRRALNNVLKTISRSASTSTTSAAAIKANEAAIATHEVKQAQVTLQQSPNYPTTWSTTQNPRPGPHSGPRFEQTDMSLQPNPLSAMELVAQEPIRLVQGRKAVCDGGGGPLGHPKIYLNLDQPGPRACGYWYVLLSIASPLIDRLMSLDLVCLLIVAEFDSNKILTITTTDTTTSASESSFMG